MPPASRQEEAETGYIKKGLKKAGPDGEREMLHVKQMLSSLPGIASDPADSEASISRGRNSPWQDESLRLQVGNVTG